MSTLKVDGIRSNSASSDAITLASDGTCTANITNNLSNRNKIKNGAMIIAQRGTSFSPTGTDQIYTLDRFQHVATSGVSWDATVTQDSSAPDGFLKSYKVTPDSTDTPTGGGNAVIRYKIEGQDLQDLAYGTSSAKSLTVSFYAKTSSENSGDQYTLCIFYFKQDGTAKTVNVAFTPTSTWQRFSFTFAGDTDASYGIRNNTDSGIMINWVLAAGPNDIKAAMSTWTVDGGYFRGVTGQDSFVDNTSNEFYLTGVQLEVGSVATDFEHRSYGQELQLCKRYYQQINQESSSTSILQSFGNGSGRLRSVLYLPVEMRTAPTVSLNVSGGNPSFYSYTGTPPTYSSVAGMESTTKNIVVDININESSQSVTAGAPYDWRGSSAFITINSEL
tara:strand:- start:152 stop:1318 length:1167 start_codon:yes stop_codon:yes gene_type:complete